MSRYALIPIEQFIEEMLNGVDYPVNIEMNNFKILEYNEQPDPTGEGWIIFKGENANIDCAEYLKRFEDDSIPLS